MKKFVLPFAVIVAAVLSSASARAEAENCEELPEARQAMCWMILSCAAVEDTDRRKECFAEAYAGFRRDTGRDLGRDDAGRVAERAPAPVAETPAVDRAPPAAPQQPSVVTSPPPARAPEVATTSTITSPPSDRPTYIETETTVRRTTVNLPKRFEATITYQRDLVRDQQLFVLDGNLLFEGDAAKEGRLRVGNEVNVVTISTLFDRDRVMVTGRGRQVRATRIRCEADDLSKSNRQKCATAGVEG
jgi:hypothetical protein